MDKRVAIYARVSKEDQTAENQLLELRENVVRRGWVADEYVDEGISGAKSSRPALNQMLEDVKAGKIGAVVVWRFDRLTRRTRHLLEMVDTFREHKVDFISLREQIDTTSPWGVMLLTLFGALAEYERESIRERVNAGIARARAEGKTLGRPKVKITARRNDVKKRVAREGYAAVARKMGVSRDVLRRWLKAGRAA